MRWTDHKTIGLQYAITASCFLLVGFLLMLVMRWQLAWPTSPLPPLLTGAFGNYLVPLQIGAPDMAFPKRALTLRRGKRVHENPWDATTLEWQTASPPPAGNFVQPPRVYRGAYDYSTERDGCDSSRAETSSTPSRSTKCAFDRTRCPE
ncbi:MAG TPA: hypothetical protein VEK56_16750 [Vicinamibacterales bacterium]|nr:hypothetical protein [Vicinamibacterales bacterium]